MIFLINKIVNLRNYIFTTQKLKSHGKNIKLPKDFSLKGKKYISIGNNFSSGRDLRLEAIDSYYENKYEPNLKIGNNVSINNNVHIGCINRIEIGDNCLIGSNVLITDHSHGNLDAPINGSFKIQNLYSKGEVIIKENVWIGENTCILAGVEIGNNVVIGCNTTVTKSLEPNSVYAGNPAKFIKKIK